MKLCTWLSCLHLPICLKSLFSLCFLSTSPLLPLLSKCSFRRSHKVISFYLRCDFRFFRSVSEWLHLSPCEWQQDGLCFLEKKIQRSVGTGLGHRSFSAPWPCSTAVAASLAPQCFVPWLWLAPCLQNNLVGQVWREHPLSSPSPVLGALARSPGPWVSPSMLRTLAPGSNRSPACPTTHPAAQAGPGEGHSPHHTYPKVVLVKGSLSACELPSSTGRCSLFSKLWKICKIYFSPFWLTLTFKYWVSRLL